MSKKKACKSCKIFVEGDQCPYCHTAQFSQAWQGRIYVVDANKSMIAQKIGAKNKGEYAIKVR